MKFEYVLKTALVGLERNKSRSALTILGIVIGITSIILIMSLGQGAQNLILQQIQSIGPKVIAIIPGREPTGPTDVLSTFTDSLKERDITALENKANVPHATEVMPIVFGSDSVAYANDTYRTTILGGTGLATSLYDIYPSEGRFINEEDVKSYADTIVIGSKVKNELFGESDAIGEKVKIKSKNFRIVGVLPKTGQLSFINFDDAVFIPYTTAQQYVFGIKYFNRIVVEVDDEKNITAATEDIKATLRNSHNITNPEKDDFFIETQAEAMESISSVTNILTLFLAAVAAISLVVGGVGIMNIMLVAVTERTREIGLRKSLGATNKNILLQFLVEAMILTIVGGIIGVLLGVLFELLISLILSSVLNLSWGFVLPFQAIILGLGVSALIGLVFGLYPARAAAKKSPIEALRYE